MGGHDLPGVRQSLPYSGLGFEDKNSKFELGHKCVCRKAFLFTPWKLMPVDSGYRNSKPQTAMIVTNIMV